MRTERTGTITAGTILRPAAWLIATTPALLLLASPTSVHAACTPPAAGGETNITITCTGTSSGWGTGDQTDVTVNVASGATVTDPTAAFNLGSGTVNNEGALSGGNWGMYVALGALTLNNSGSLIGGAYGIQAGGVSVVNNAGAAIEGGSGHAIWGTTADVTNYGTIRSNTIGVVAIYTSGDTTIRNYAGGFIGGIRSDGNTLNVVNDGIIAMTGYYNGVSNQALTLTNSGSITATLVTAVQGGTVDVVNSGTISSSGASGIESGSGRIRNVAGATISGTYAAIASSNGIEVENAGSITATQGDAILNANFMSPPTRAAKVSNAATGSIIGTTSGVMSASTVDITNYGLIRGDTGIIAQGSGSSVLNAGNIPAPAAPPSRSVAASTR